MNKLEELASRVPTMAFTSRVDMRHLATLARLWQSKGSHPRSISELVRLSMESFCEILVTSGQVDFIESQMEAQEILGQLGLLNKTVLKRNLVAAMVKEGNLEMLDQVREMPKATGKMSSASPVLLQAQKKLDDAIAADLQSRVKNDSDRTKELLSSLGHIPEEV